MTAGGAAAAAELPLCPVCCETLGRWGGPATLPCGHNGCLDCFRQVQQRNAQCPYCRASFGRELKLSCNHELEDLIRLATMLFVDESAQQDGWEAFPTQQLTADSYAAELMRGHKKATAGTARAPSAALGHRGGRGSPPAAHGASPSTGGGSSSGRGGSGGGSGGGGGGFSLSILGLSSLGFGGGGGNPNALEDLHDIMNDDPLASAAAAAQRRHSDGSDGGLDWDAPSAPSLLDDGHHQQRHPAAGTGGGAGPSWLPYGNASIMLAREGASGAASNLLSLDPPLWLPDSHASECLSCHLPFRPFTRLRHHCRLCGRIYCNACCHKRALLPPKYGVRTPQRVCELCACALAPHQQLLAGTLAAAAQPPVQDCPDAVSLRAWLNSPWTGSLGEDVFKAANMLTTMVRSLQLQAEAGLPTAALQGAAGLALLTVARVGAGWSLSFGTGLVVARTPSGGWSAPCAVSAAGLGWGLQLGGELADVLLVLRSREALGGLCGGLGAGVVLGGAAGVAVGPVGRHADASLVLGGASGAAAYGYSCSKGAFVGVSLESSLLCVRSQVNHDFYGYPVTPRQLLLEGAVPPPPAAAMLYEGIKALLHRFECRRHLDHSRHSASAPHLRPHPQPQQVSQRQQHPSLPAQSASARQHASQQPTPPQQVQLQSFPLSSEQPAAVNQAVPARLPPLAPPPAAAAAPASQSSAPPHNPVPSAPPSPPLQTSPVYADADALPFSLFDGDDDCGLGLGLGNMDGAHPSKMTSTAVPSATGLMQGGQYRLHESSYYPECPLE